MKRLIYFLISLIVTSCLTKKEMVLTYDEHLVIVDIKQKELLDSLINFYENKIDSLKPRIMYVDTCLLKTP